MLSSDFIFLQVDTYDWWKHIFINNYRLGPRYGDYSVEIAYVQLVLTAVAFLLHIPNALSVRKFSYAILAVFYAVTQLRHFLFGYGVEEAAYLYINTVVFAILVLHNDKRSRSQSHKKLS